MQTWLLYLHFVFSRDVKRWQNNINIIWILLLSRFCLSTSCQPASEIWPSSGNCSPALWTLPTVRWEELAESSEMSGVNGEMFQHVSFTAIKINESWPVATPVLWSSHGRYLFHYITLQTLCVFGEDVPSPPLPCHLIVNCDHLRLPRRTASSRTGAWWSSTLPSRPSPPWRHWATPGWTIFQSGSSIVFQTSTPSIFIWVLSTTRWKTGESIIDF